MDHAPRQPVDVAFRPCRDYASALPGALDRLADDLGGWSRLVPSGTVVLVKPNLLTDRRPDEAVTTHPALLRAVLLRLQACGARLTVGDSPASAVQLAQVWEKTGVRGVCDELGVPLVSFEQGGARRIVHGGLEFNVAVDALDAQLIVNLPKVKSHGLTTLTAAVKNLYGTLPGYQKAQRHKENADPRDFGRYVRVLLDTLPPILTIADGVVGMEGEGPSNGTPVTLGFLAASTNPVALDLALCQALSIPVARVPYLTDDAAAGAGRHVRRVGVPLDTLNLPPFRLPPPSPARYLPRALVKLVSPYLWVRPRFNDLCVRCGRCVKACPMQALRLDGADRPRLDGSRCIGCCCCHEVCPARAIHMRQSPLLRAVGAFKGL